MQIKIDSPKTPIDGGQSFNVNDASNASFNTLAAVPGYRHEILELGISIETADDITVKAGSTVLLGPLYLGDRSGIINDYKDVDFIGGVGEAITVEKGNASTAVTVFGKYRTRLA